VRKSEEDEKGMDVTEEKSKRTPTEKKAKKTT
jgi:hypothetical protein